MSRLIKSLFIIARYIPFTLLYIFSNFLSVVFRKGIKYRLTVVQNNLRNSFPHLSLAELKLIEKKFYRNLTDVFLESLKLYTISKKSLQKRMKLVNPEVFQDLQKEGKGAILIGAHFNNWEWMALALGTYMQQDLYSVYKPIKEKSIDELMLKIRSRFGASIVPMKAFPKTVLKNKNRATVNLMLSDQSPHKSKLDYYSEFLNQDTPVYLGAEKLMNAAGLALLFVEVKRIKRGYYEMKIVSLADKDSGIMGASTELHLSHLESLIMNEPQNWLWSHKRWKHSRKK